MTHARGTRREPSVSRRNGECGLHLANRSRVEIFKKRRTPRFQHPRKTSKLHRTRKTSREAKIAYYRMSHAKTMDTIRINGEHSDVCLCLSMSIGSRCGEKAEKRPCESVSAKDAVAGSAGQINETMG